MRARTQLYRALDFESAWKHLFQPWFEARRAEHAGDPLPALPAAVLIPTMAYGQFLKSRIVEAGIPILGIHFLTPGECWILLCDRLGLDSRAASREDLHLLLSIAAAEFPALPSARSIAVDPAAFMRSLDQLAAAGWEWTDLDIKSLHPLIRRFRALLGEAGLRLAQDTDRELAAAAPSSKPVFSALLVAGFDGRHWPVWSLLNSAVKAAQQATVCLYDPRPTAAAIDQIWFGSWEEACGEAEPLPEPEKAYPLADLTDAMEMGATCTGAPVTLHIGNDQREEAQAIVAQAMTYLADPTCRRVGIAFPGPGPLARETARLLAEHGIAHNDSLGHNGAPPTSDLAWREWLSLHEQPDVRRFLAFLALCPEADERLGMPVSSLEKELRQAYEELMVDDLQVLVSHLRHPIQGDLHWLPDTATLATFVAATRKATEAWPSLGGEERQRLIEEEAAPFDSRWRQPLPRRLFVRWLTEITTRAHRVRDAAGSHPYARVQLLPYDKAEWQANSHAILAGLNRNSWPPDFPAQPFLDPILTDRLNATAIREGSQGAGHLVVAPGKGLIISPAERSAHVRRQFYNIIESVTGPACFTASRTDPENPSRLWNPSELLVRVHATAFPGGLSDTRMEFLQLRTSQWLAKSTALRSSLLTHDKKSTLQTRRAYDARRDPAQPFGPWEFALRTPPVPPPTISCTAWQTAIGWPELAWMATFLGVADASWSPEEIPWAKVIGQWVHRWVHTALGITRKADKAPHTLPPRSAMNARFAEAAQSTLAQAEKAFAHAGRQVPDWWRFVHRQAAATGQQLVDIVATLAEQGWSRGATEWPLPDPALIPVPGGATLFVRGRMDLVLFNGESDPCWILDYKTGGAPSLTPGTVADGSALQILLYGMALREIGYARVQMSFAAPDEGLGTAREIGSLLDESRVKATLQLLGQMQTRGVFGMRGAIRPEHGMAPAHPLATLRINPDILEEKAVLTFGRDAEGQAPEGGDA